MTAPVVIRPNQPAAALSAGEPVHTPFRLARKRQGRAAFRHAGRAVLFRFPLFRVRDGFGLHRSRSVPAIPVASQFLGPFKAARHLFSAASVKLRQKSFRCRADAFQPFRSFVVAGFDDQHPTTEPKACRTQMKGIRNP